MLTINFWPNPASDILNVEFPTSHDVVQLEVLAADGRVVIKSSVLGASGVTPINLNQLSSGMYVLRLLSTANAEQYRFVKN